MNKREEQMGMEYWKKRALKAEAALEEIQSLTSTKDCEGIFEELWHGPINPRQDGYLENIYESAIETLGVVERINK